MDVQSSTYSKFYVPCTYREVSNVARIATWAKQFLPIDEARDEPSALAPQQVDSDKRKHNPSATLFLFSLGLLSKTCAGTFFSTPRYTHTPPPEHDIVNRKREDGPPIKLPPCDCQASYRLPQPARRGMKYAPTFPAATKRSLPFQFRQ